jgi:IS1 family transposase
MTIVDRRTSCILSWHVDGERTQHALQRLVDTAPQARFYYSDLFATYRTLVYYPGLYTPMPDKSETLRVEGDNAELRHDLARLARCSRWFFSLCSCPAARHQTLCLGLASSPSLSSALS